MKCRICGHRSTTLNAMRIHYVKNHPTAMRRKPKKHWKDYPAEVPEGRGLKFCPYCGARRA